MVKARSCSVSTWRMLHGLAYTEEWMTKEYEAKVLADIDLAEWSERISRRTQHYGRRYDYNDKRLHAAPVMLDRLQRVADSLEKTLSIRFNQCIVNEYTEGQGIAQHVDSPLFGNTIATVTLNDSVVLTLQRGNEHRLITLNPRSLLVLSGESRYTWSHGIQRVHTTSHGYRRVSLTYRSYCA